MFTAKVGSGSSVGETECRKIMAALAFAFCAKKLVILTQERGREREFESVLFCFHIF